MNVLDIAEFYSSARGKVTQELIARKLAMALGARADQCVVGIGYAVPYLGLGSRNLAFMLARSGVMRWPEEGAARSALVDELDLPLGDNVADVTLLIHSLEFAESAEDMLAEAWRILAPQGKLLLVVPNRSGLWSASEASPFGRGQPFSRSQISGLLKEAQFSLTRIERTLVLPPWGPLGLARAVEHAGHFGFGRFSGVIVVEARKQVFAYATGKPARRALPRLRPMLLHGPQPAGHAMSKGAEYRASAFL